MLLSDVFDHLTYGELSQVAVGGRDSGGVQLEDYPMVISHINMGVIELYKRFPLKLSQVIIQLYSEIGTYYLDSKYAESNTSSTEPKKYIMDGVQPFDNDVLIIDSVYDEDGQELPLNEEEMTYSVFTPTYNSIQVPFSDEANAINVVYRAAPARISKSITDPTTVDVEIPYQLLDPLLLYIGSRVHSSLNLDNASAEANNYYQKFEASCNKVLELGLSIVNQHTNVRLWRDGWV